MAVNKVDLYVSQILEDLDNGLTWLKRDDIGYGSIQEKYNAKDQQIVMIRKHPALKDAETNITVFNIIDDTKNETTTISPVEQQDAKPVECVPSPDAKSKDTITTDRTAVHGSVDQGIPFSKDADVEQSADAFFSI